MNRSNCHYKNIAQKFIDLIENNLKDILNMINMKHNLLDKIETRQLTVGVIGLGYVGLPLAVEKAKAGFKTIGFDIQPYKVNMINSGENYIGDVVDKYITAKG